MPQSRNLLHKQDTGFHSCVKSLLSIWVLLLPLILMPCSEYSISPQSPRGEASAGTAGSARHDGRTRGPAEAKGFRIGKCSVREKGEVGRGQKGEKEAEKGSRTKQPGGYSRHPKPLNRALSPGGVAVGGRGCFPRRWPAER